MQGLPQSSWTKGRTADMREDQWILRDLADLLNGANWQRVGDPNAERPSAVPRPGDAERAARKHDDDETDVNARAVAMRRRAEARRLELGGG